MIASQCRSSYDIKKINKLYSIVVVTLLLAAGTQIEEESTERDSQFYDEISVSAL
jgi:hypothetical protein